MTSLFISYSRKDIDFARKFTERLKDQDLDFWIDWEGIPPTVDWWQEIARGIEKANIFVFLISPDSIKSKVCRQEIEHAVKNGKRLIPVVVRDIQAEESPAELGHLNWIFLRENDPFDQGFNKMMTAIRTDYEWVQIHSQLQIKALEWERNNHETSFLLRGKELQDAELQLSANSSKEPRPTDLQRDYVLKSRQATDKQRRLTTAISTAGIIALAALAVFGFYQARQATSQANIALTERANSETNLVAANTAQADAESAQSTAVANEKEAQKQAQIALARQLAAQAQTLLSNGNPKQQTAVLLAIQSMSLYPIADTARILRENTLSKPIAVMRHDSSVNSVAFSPDGKYVVSGSEDGTARVWEVSTGKEISRVKQNGWIFVVAFSPDGKFIATGGCDQANPDSSDPCTQGSARVWEVNTGKEISHMEHNDWVYTLAFSLDGKYVASGGFDNTIRVWEAGTGREISYMVHSYYPESTSADYYINSVGFSPDGKYIVSGSADNTARVWEVRTGREISRVTYFVVYEHIIGGAGGGRGGVDGRGGGSGVTSVAFSPDGKYVVSAGCLHWGPTANCIQGSARLWDFDTGNVVAHMAHDARVSAVAFSPDGKYVVSADDNGNTVVWESATGVEIARMTYGSSIYSVAFSPDGKYVVAGSADNTARVLNIATNQEVARITHDGQVYSVAFSPDGKYVVSGSADGTVRVWEASTETEITHMKLFGQFSPDGKYVISEGCDKRDSNQLCTQTSAHVWEVSTGREIISLTNQPLIFSPDSKYMVAYEENTVRLWETATGQEIAHMTHDDRVETVIFSPDSKYIVSSSSDKTARVWEVSTGKEISRVTHDTAVQAVAFSPDGKYVASGDQGQIRVWEASTGKQISLTTGIDVRSIAFSSDGKYIVSGPSVYEAASGKEVAHTPTQVSTILDAIFSPNGRYVASLGVSVADIWEVSTGKEISRMNFGETPFNVTAVAFSSDSRYVVAGSCDLTDKNNANSFVQCVQSSARVWEAATGKEIARMIHDGVVNFVSFSPDDRYVLSRSTDNPDTYMWIYLPQDLIVNACYHVTRNLTRSEWQQFVGEAAYRPVCTNLPVEPESTITTTLTAPAEIGSTNNVALSTPAPGLIQPTDIALTALPTFSVPTWTDFQAVPELVNAFVEYTVQPGDSLYSIAQKYGVTIESMMTDNNISDANLISAGQTLRIRVNTVATPSISTPTPGTTP